MQYSRDQILLGIVGLMAMVIAFEIAFSIKRKIGLYNLKESVSNVLMGLGQQVVNLLIIPILVYIYSSIQSSIGFFEISKHELSNWLILIPLSDFLFYCAHRSSHRINIFVAAHIGHHQSEDYNLVSAWRQSWTANIFVFPFFVPLALLGFKVEMFMLAQLGIMFIQFFSHCGAITKHLGILEYIFVTPRSHRVHHGIHAKYIDKNCGGMLIIWDRIFGTYQDLEEDNITIGVRGKMNYLAPLESNSNYFRRILFVMKNRKGFLSKLKILFQTPEVLSEGLIHFQFGASDLKDYKKIKSTTFAKLELTLLMSVSLIMTLTLMSTAKALGIFPKIFFGSLNIYLLHLTGLCLSGKRTILSDLFEVFDNSSEQSKSLKYQK